MTSSSLVQEVHHAAARPHAPPRRTLGCRACHRRLPACAARPDRAHQRPAGRARRACGPSTVVRFCQRFGFAGYDDFRAQFLAEMRYIVSHFDHVDPNYPFSFGERRDVVAHKIGALYQEIVDDTLGLLDAAWRCAVSSRRGASAATRCWPRTRIRLRFPVRMMTASMIRTASPTCAITCLNSMRAIDHDGVPVMGYTMWGSARHRLRLHRRDEEALRRHLRRRRRSGPRHVHVEPQGQLRLGTSGSSPPTAHRFMRGSDRADRPAAAPCPAARPSASRPARHLIDA